jgi:hypothetical protein
MNHIEDKVDWKELVNPPVSYDVRLGLEFGKPNGNDRVYTEEVWNKAMTEAKERANNGELLVYAGEPVLTNAIASVAEIAINRNEACAGVRFQRTGGLTSSFQSTLSTMWFIRRS